MGIIQARYLDFKDDISPSSESSLNFNSYDYIPFGSDNLFPQALALFSRVSPNHRGILNSKHRYIIGKGVTSEEDAFLDELKAINFEGENFNSVVSKLAVDDLRFGNGWIEFITDRNGSFLWYNHLDATKCRLAKNKEEVIIHPDWRQYKGKTDKLRRALPLYPNWEADKGEDGFNALRTVVHVKDYEPEFVYYGLPDYIAAKDSVQIDFKTNKWNLARLKNSFRISGMLVVPVKDEAESKQVLDHINKNFIGEDNQAKLLTITKSRAQETEKADQTQFVETKQNDEGSWMDLHKQSTSDMIVTHSWFRSLAGLSDNTGFDTQRILNEYETAKNTVISDYQEKYVNLFKQMYLEVQGREVEMAFMNQAPFDTDNYKYIWELRKEKGLEYDEKDPAQQVIISNQGTTKEAKNG